MTNDPGSLRVEAVVLAGAYRWTDSGFDSTLPKALMPVALTPAIQYSLRWCSGGGVGSVVLCGNSSTAALRAHLGAGEGVGIRLDYYEDFEPRGAAGCLKDAAAALTADILVVVDATVIPRVDLRDLVRSHVESGAAFTVVARTHPEGPSPVGIYVVGRSVLDYVPAVGFHDIKESLIPRLHQAGLPIRVYEVAESAPRLFDAKTYLSANLWMLERLADEPDGTLGEGYHREREAYVHESAVLEPGAIVVGPVVVGPGAYVQQGATVVGPAVIGPGSLVERDAVVSRAVIWDRVHVGEGSLVDHSVLATGARVAPSATVVGAMKTGPAPREAATSVASSRLGSAGRVFGTGQPPSVPAPQSA